jgi:hypothetical protein
MMVQCSLNLANISHQVLDVWWMRDQLLGIIEILPTPSGLLLWELYSQVRVCKATYHELNMTWH